nr:reverse transcriptase domain-containing protein [Tanacetum cinerariifolium]
VWVFVGEGSGGEVMSWVSGGEGWKAGIVGLWSLEGKVVCGVNSTLLKRAGDDTIWSLGFLQGRGYDAKLIALVDLDLLLKVTEVEGDDGVECCVFVEPNQHDDVPVDPEPFLVDEDKDPKEDEFEEEEDPQEEEDDMEVDIEKDENDLELTYHYEEDETIPASVHVVCESSAALFLREDSDGLFLAHALVEMKRKEKDKYYGKLILDLDNKVRSSVEQGTAVMEKLVEKLSNVEDKVECKKLKNELEEARIMPPKSAPLTQAAICRMVKENVDTAIAVERARQANVRNDASGSGPVRGQDAAPAVHECTFAGFMKCNPTVFTLMIAEFCLIDEIQIMEHELWKLKVKEYNIVAYTHRFNELALMCPRMVEPEIVKFNAYIRGLTDNIKGKVTSSKPANLNEAVRMAHKLMEQKSQARDERILEGNKQKWERFQSGNSS